jgi:hypothetical protein
MQTFYKVLNYLMIAGALSAIAFGLTRRRQAPSPVPLQHSPDEALDPSAIRPAAAPHQVVWSGFMARALIALNLVITLVAVSNAPAFGSTALMACCYAFSLRLMWPLISDTPRHG